MIFYTPMINGIEQSRQTDLKECVRLILQLTSQEERLIKEYGEKEYEEVVLAGMLIVLSMVPLTEGEIQLSKEIKIKVETFVE